MRLFATMFMLAVGVAPVAAQDAAFAVRGSIRAPDRLTRTERYGREPGQSIDFSKPAGASTTALIVEFSSAGWENTRNVSLDWLNSLLIGKGYAYAAVSTRSRVNTRLSEHVADAAAAIAWLQNATARNHLDATRIILVAEGSGAVLAALLATDPTLLASVGVDFGAIRGVYLLGPSGLELSATIEPGRSRDFNLGDAATRTRLSPATHVPAPNAPAFLIQADDRDTIAKQTSRACADLLIKSGTSVELQIVPPMTTLSTTLRVTDNAATRGVLAFLDRLG